MPRKKMDVDTLIAYIVSAVAEIGSTIPREKAIAHFNDRISPRHDVPHVAASGSDQYFLARITVNYIRHVLTPYDHIIEMLARPGYAHERTLVKQRTLEAIARQFPALQQECQRQATWKLEP